MAARKVVGGSAMAGGMVSQVTMKIRTVGVIEFLIFVPGGLIGKLIFTRGSRERER